MPQADAVQRFVDDQMPHGSRHTATTARCSTKQKDIDAVDRRHARPHARGDRLGRDGRRQARVRRRSRCAGRWTKRAISRRRRPTIRSSSRRWATRAIRRTTRGRGQDYLAAGAIGDIREVHVWTNRPLGYWPQGVPRRRRKSHGRQASRPRLEQRRRDRRGWPTRSMPAVTTPVPEGLSWDLFLGVAPDVDVPPDLSPVQLARMGGLGPGRARRHGRAPDRSPRLGSEARAARRRSKRCRRRSTARRYPMRDDDATTSSPAREGMPAGQD